MNDKIRLAWDKSEKSNLVSRPHNFRPASITSIIPAELVTFALLVMAALGYWCYDCATLETRAMRGEPKAQYRLGKRNLDYAKSAAEHAEAAEWIRKSADHGNAAAQTGLGLLYINGVGVRRDYSEAIKWLKRAAAQDVAVAQNELGVIYAKGRGVPQDLDESIIWCSRAATQGSKVARQNLALVQAAKCSFFGDITTCDGKLHKNVKLQSVDPDGITVELQPEGGAVVLAKLKVENLTGQFKELCGYTAKGATNSSPFSQLDCITARL